MGKLQEMKQKAEEVRRRLDDTELHGESSSGSVKVTVSGSRKVKRVTVNDALLSSGADRAGMEIAEAVNRAIEAADRLNEDEMKKAAGGLLPGF